MVKMPRTFNLEVNKKKLAKCTETDNLLRCVVKPYDTKPDKQKESHSHPASSKQFKHPGKKFPKKNVYLWTRTSYFLE